MIHEQLREKNKPFELNENTWFYLDRIENSSFGKIIFVHNFLKNGEDISCQFEIDEEKRSRQLRTKRIILT